MSVLLYFYNKINDHFICFIKRLYFVLYYLVFVQCLIAYVITQIPVLGPT